ncbi:ATP-binding protein [Pelagibius sp.]|uniref:sensor histidine kinase n=1 Tax=Pelagibius sp. TaxID=1931238 RepID=UPI002619CDE6|nr:ATP-binding protein [Pelagibius sp.]
MESPRRWHRAALGLAAAAAATGIVVAVTWVWASALFLDQTHTRALARLDLYSSNLAGALGRYQSVPTLLALRSDVVELFRRSRDPESQARANLLTESFNRLTEAEDTYFMDAEGFTFAASNWNSERPFVGHNFSYRPYFQEAMEGRLGRYFALGTTSGRRGYYFAYQVSADDQVLGAVVVKISLADIEASWTAKDEGVIVSDPHGVIFISSRPAWRFRSLAPLDDAARQAIAENRRYEAVDLRPLDIAERGQIGETAGAAGARLLSISAADGGSAAEYLMVSREMPAAGWTVSVLASTDLARSQSLTAGLVAGLACLITVLIATLIAQRRGRLVERIAYQRRASEELERRVVERTADLTAANLQLAREIGEREAAEADLRQAQDDLVQAGKLAALGQMSAALSHEFNQPLAAIRSYADNARLLIERERHAEAGENLSRIKTLTGRMAEISKHLMTFARKPRSELRPLRVAEVLDDTLDFLRIRLERAGAEVTVTQADRSLRVRAGRVRLQHVILNLVANALDAMEGQERPRIEIAVRESDGKVVLALRDHGPGIDPGQIDRIFDPFFTTKDVGKGLGLGLSISYNIVKDFEGAIRAENHRDGGALFTVELPLLPAPAPVLEPA